MLTPMAWAFIQPIGRHVTLQGRRYLTSERPSAHENSRSSSFGGDAF